MTCLMVVDMQNDFVKSTGSLSVPDGESLVSVINDLRESRDWDLVVLTRDWHPVGHVSFASSHIDSSAVFEKKTLPDGTQQMMWPDHCVQDSKGAAFHDQLIIRSDTDLVVDKGTDPKKEGYSAFSNVTLAPLLHSRDIKRIVIVGLAFDYCVGETALDGAELGFEVEIYSKGTRSVSPSTEALMRRRLVEVEVSLS